MVNAETQIGCVSNLFVRMMHFKNAGDIEIGRSHKFDHLILLSSGRLQVKVDGQDTEFTAPHMIYAKKEKVYELMSLDSNTVAYCVHVARIGSKAEDIVDPAMVPAGVPIPQDDLFKVYETGTN